ncbi:hypothetical protein ACU635_47850 [[Actinomadura] parvosata]|uniref:hypothetical protein n=1 Tax=[Actinomadura] parvosata TaxID=1955412 RepID=UPI00406C00B0
MHGLGALTYHLLTGQVPAKPEHRVPPSALRPEVPEAVDVGDAGAGPGPRAALAGRGRVRRRPVLPHPGAARPVLPHARTAPPQDGGRPENDRPENDHPEGDRSEEGRAAGGDTSGGTPGGTSGGSPGGISGGTAHPAATTGSPSATHPGPARSMTEGSTARWLREDSDIPREYRTLIVRAGTYCAEPGLSPA